MNYSDHGRWIRQLAILIMVAGVCYVYFSDQNMVSEGVRNWNNANKSDSGDLMGMFTSSISREEYRRLPGVSEQLAIVWFRGVYMILGALILYGCGMITGAISEREARTSKDKQ